MKFSFLLHLLGDVKIQNLTEELKEFLEDAGKNKELKKIDDEIFSLQSELDNLKKENSKNYRDITNLRENLEDLNEKKSLNDIKKEETRLNKLEKDYKSVEAQMDKINEDITNLKCEKDELIKKCLMRLHTDIKKHHQKVNEDHDMYVKLYTQAREERHVLERKMMNLKSIVYKNYKVRLI